MRETLFWILLLSTFPFIWRRPFWGVTLYCFFNIVRPEMMFWGGNTAARTFQIIAFITILASFFNYSGRFIQVRLFSYPNLYLWFIMWFALLFSTILSPYAITIPGMENSKIDYLNELLKILVLCYLIVMFMKNYKDIIFFETILLCAISCLGIWGIQQYFVGNVRLEGLGGASYLDSNGIAAMFVLFTPIALSYCFGENKWENILGLLASLILIIAIICTSSRGGAVGLIIAILIVILRYKKFVHFAVIGLILYGMSAPFITKEYMERLNTLEDVENIDYSGLSRFVLWKTGLLVFRDNPIMGVGFMSFKEAKMNYKYTLPIDEELREYAFRPGKVGHNTYIQVISEGGLLSFIPYVLFLFSTLFANRQIRRKYKQHPNAKKFLNLLAGIDTGIIGFCVCIIGIDAIVDVMLPVQITICAILRARIKEGDLIIK